MRAVDVILSKKVGNDEADIHYYDLTFLNKAVSKSSEHKTAVVRGNVPSLYSEIELMSAELKRSDISTNIYQGQVARADRQHTALTERPALDKHRCRYRIVPAPHSSVRSRHEVMERFL